jgi:hypothetical protein
VCVAALILMRTLFGQQGRNRLRPNGQDFSLLLVRLTNGLSKHLQKARELVGRGDAGGVEDASDKRHHFPVRTDEGPVHL